MVFIRVGALMLVAWMLGGCATTGGQGEKMNLEASILASEIEGTEITERFDLNGDKEPDVWKISFLPDESGEKTLLRKELDINFDGKVDILKFYDVNGDLEREEMDLDFDGRIDAANVYDAGVLAVREVDTAFDGGTDVWKYYDAGALVRKERDANGDGAVDSWEYFKDGKLTRVGSDRDGDGEPEFFEDAPEGL